MILMTNDGHFIIMLSSVSLLACSWC